MSKVRALKDGTYGGFERVGPRDGIPGIAGGESGEVFEIEDGTFEAIDSDTGKPIMEAVLDARGNAILETVMMQAVDEKGNPVVGPDKKPLMSPVQRPRMKIKTWQWFTPEWMEQVPDNTPITFEEKEAPAGVHKSMKLKRVMASSKPKALSELQAEMGKEIVGEEAVI